MTQEEILKLHESFAEYLDGSYLIGSSDIWLPFYRKGIDVSFVREEQLNIIEEFIGKCIEEDIQDVKDIAEVLSIPKTMLIVMLDSLADQQFIKYTCDHKAVSFTDKGMELFKQKLKHVDTVEEFIVYFDGITAENQIKMINDQETFVKWQTMNKQIRIQDRHFPLYDSEEDFHALKSLFLKYKNQFTEKSDNLNGLKTSPIIDVKSFSYQSIKELNYRKYTMLIYADQDSIVQALVFDTYSEELVPSFHAPVTAKLIEGYFDDYFDLDKAINQHERHMKELNNPPNDVFSYIMTREISDKFLYFLENAKDSLYIISPWMNSYIVNNEFKAKLRNLLNRGVNIRIIYGINSEENKDERDSRTEKLADQLRELGQQYDGLLQLRHGHTHEKLLICDDKYYLNGSYNFLSYSPEGKGFFRNEGCTYIEDESYAREAAKERFSF